MTSLTPLSLHPSENMSITKILTIRLGSLFSKIQVIPERGEATYIFTFPDIWHSQYLFLLGRKEGDVGKQPQAADKQPPPPSQLSSAVLQSRGFSRLTLKTEVFDTCSYH